MKIIDSIEAMRAWSAEQRKANKTIAFVPTMGAFHEGHLALMREGASRVDVCVVSIYVNPTQFGPNEDLAKYPRDLDGDLAQAKECGVEAVFVPTNEMMYPEGYRTYVTVEGMSDILCGASRPTHFRGVTTVCAKLFTIVNPDAVIMGEKDYQQLVILRRMVQDLDMPVEIVGLPTVRESDGLAMSSRNAYLSDDERRAARSLSLALSQAREMVEKGERDIAAIKDIVKSIIEAAKLPNIDYVAIVDSATLEETTELPARLLIAAHVGPARLIDNCQLG